MNYVGVGAATVLLSGEPIRVLDPNIRGLALNRYLNVPYMVGGAGGAAPGLWDPALYPFGTLCVQDRRR